MTIGGVSQISIARLEKEMQARPDLQKSLERFRARGRASEERQKKQQEEEFAKVLEKEMQKEENE